MYVCACVCVRVCARAHAHVKFRSLNITRPLSKYPSDLTSIYFFCSFLIIQQYRFFYFLLLPLFVGFFKPNSFFLCNYLSLASLTSIFLQLCYSPSQPLPFYYLMSLNYFIHILFFFFIYYLSPFSFSTYKCKHVKPQTKLECRFWNSAWILVVFSKYC